MVFQSHALYPHMTVRENMAFGLRRRGCPRDEIGRRVAWAAELLGLEGLLDRKPHTLSGGQRQRVALGRAVVRRPKLFLFDEPLSNLDARLRTDTRAELKRLHRKLATTTLYVTHDQEEAMTLAERIAVLRGGRIQQCGTPLEVYNAPANRFVAGFIGTPAMNFIDGRLQQDAAGQTWFESPCLRVPIGKSLVRSIGGVPAGPVPASRSASGPTTSNCGLAGTGKGTGPICRHGPAGCCAQIGPVPFSGAQAPGASPARSRWSSRWAARWTCTSRRRAERGWSAAPPSARSSATSR